MSASRSRRPNHHTRSRDHLPGGDSRGRGIFVPSLAVFRPVETGEVSKAMMTGIATSIKTKNPLRSNRRHYRTFDHNVLGLKIVEQKKMVHGLRQAEHKPTHDQMLNLAQAVHDAMQQLLLEKTSPGVMQLGRLARFGHKKNKLVVQSVGWKGPNSRYPSADPDVISSNESHVMDREVCIGAMEQLLTKDSNDKDIGINPTEMIGIPHLSLVSKEGNINDKELRAFQELVVPTLPDELDLGNPVVTVRTAPGKRGLQRFEITPQSEARIIDPILGSRGEVTVPARLAITYPS